MHWTMLDHDFSLVPGGVLRGDLKPSLGNFFLEGIPESYALLANHPKIHLSNKYLSLYLQWFCLFSIWEQQNNRETESPIIQAVNM